LQGHDWQAIVRDHGPAVWQTAYRLLANHSDAADCFQESFLAAFEIASREPVRNVAGLLVRLATTRAIDRHGSRPGNTLAWSKPCQNACKLLW